MNSSDLKTLSLICTVLVLLGAAWAIVKLLKRRPDSGLDTAILETFERAGAGVVDLVRHPGGGFPAGPRGDGDPVRADLLLGPARVHHHHAYPPRRPSAPWSGCRSFSAAAVRAGVCRLVRPVQHLHPGLRLPLRSGHHRPGRRSQAVSGADREDSMGAVDLRLLPQLRPRPADAQLPSAARRPAARPGCCSSSC